MRLVKVDHLSNRTTEQVTDRLNTDGADKLNSSKSAVLDKLFFTASHPETAGGCAPRSLSLFPSPSVLCDKWP
ncbi:hypothetical protein [Rhizobium sp. Nf11,1]|uniref:hypothetical protein n=1 Tax=unclassified Rhizobium TaxID=2613769 RepID=UPI003D345FF6